MLFRLLTLKIVCLKTVDVDSVNLLQSRLENFWKHQDVRYDYKTDLTGTGDLSGGVNVREI